MGADQKHQFNSFILGSRHSNISTIIILHSFPFGHSRDSLTENYLRNATLIVVFRFINDNRSANLFANNILSKEYAPLFRKCFEFSEKLAQKDGNKPFVLVDCSQQKQFATKANRIRLDIFNRNLILNNII